MRFEWRKRTMSGGAGRSRTRLEAVLIDCAPSVKTAGEEDCFLLGTLDERFLTVREFDLQSFQFGLFWKEVHQNLDGLVLEPVVREELERRIEEKISKPPEDWALWPKKCSLVCRLKHQNPAK
jgi:hypothetical protein